MGIHSSIYGLFRILTWLLTAANLMAVVVAAVLLYFPSPPPGDSVLPFGPDIKSLFFTFPILFRNTSLYLFFFLPRSVSGPSHTPFCYCVHQALDRLLSSSGETPWTVLPCIIITLRLRSIISKDVAETHLCRDPSASMLDGL